MKTEIATIDIQNEMDLVLAHRRAMQICKFAGIGLSEQTRFATAVSEICRNALEYCKEGHISFSIYRNGEHYKCEAVITDAGTGINNIEEILKRNPQQHRGRGIGIVFARKLVDKFNITTSSSGTRVILEKNVPVTETPINNLIIQGWIKHIKSEPSLSAYEELKNRNAQLLQLTEELKEEKSKVSDQFAEIKKLNDQTELSNSYMRQFTYMISHDLKTPLTNLNLAMSMIEEEEAPETQKQYLNIIKRASKKLERTILGVVEILEIQNKEHQMAKIIDLAEAWEEITEQVILQYPDVSFKQTADFSLGNKFYYIPAFVNSILLNLTTNAIKYRHPDRELELKISSQYLKDTIVISYSDNGQGIDLEKYGASIFTPFTRFSTTTEGKGIGLYIIKTMLEKNRGRIEIESEPGKGTTFKMYLKEYL